jgi:hypothetical protein
MGQRLKCGSVGAPYRSSTHPRSMHVLHNHHDLCIYPFTTKINPICLVVLRMFEVCTFQLAVVTPPSKSILRDGARDETRVTFNVESFTIRHPDATKVLPLYSKTKPKASELSSMNHVPNF